MGTIIRCFADLHLLKDMLTELSVSGDSIPCTMPLPNNEMENGQYQQPIPLLTENLESLAKLQKLLQQHDLWLGYSSIKGWVLLDRKHPEYREFNRPFVLLRDGSIDRLSREEFSQEPQGPWALRFWKNLDLGTQQIAGPASALLPEVLRYIEKAEQAARLRAEHAIERNEDLSTRIDEPPFSEELYYSTGLDFQEKWAAARIAHYTKALPMRIRWLSDWAKQIKSARPGLEPEWSRGIAAASYLHENGISHLWHFTDTRNLDAIRREGGLLSWAGLKALGVTDTYPVADDYSRSCDAGLGRERYVRLSFIPNSWFFHRVRCQSRLVWLRFSLQSLSLGEIFYSYGNAASGFVALQDTLPLMDINWGIVKAFCDSYTEDRGPTIYRSLFKDQVGDPMLFRQISSA